MERNTMKALRSKRLGPPSVLSLRDVEFRNPGRVSVIELRAAAINPSDVKNVAGVFHATLPRIPGRDYAGVVVEGEGWKGREVWGSGAGLGVTQDGTHAQYLVVPSTHSPKSLRSSPWRSVEHRRSYLAAWSALVDAAEVRAGETVLVAGALGAVGRPRRRSRIGRKRG